MSDFITIDVETVEKESSTCVIRISDVVCFQRTSKTIAIVVRGVPNPWMFNLSSNEAASDLFKRITMVINP